MSFSYGAWGRNATENTMHMVSCAGHGCPCMMHISQIIMSSTLCYAVHIIT